MDDIYDMVTKVFGSGEPRHVKLPSMQRVKGCLEIGIDVIPDCMNS